MNNVQHVTTPQYLARTIQRLWQHWVNKTQEEDKQSKKHNTGNN